MAKEVTRAVNWARSNPLQAAGIAAACAGFGAAIVSASVGSNADCPAEYSADEDFLADQFFKSNTSGLLIFQQTWLVPDASAVVVCLHGGGEHSGRYAHIAKYFNARGLSVCALDHAGHGRSEGTRMHSRDLGGSVADIQQYIAQHVQPLARGAPVFLLGHSIGGLLAALVATAAPPGQLAAVALTGPCITLGGSMQDLVAQAALPVLATLFPKLRVAGPRAVHLAHSPAVQRQYARDPLNSSSCTLAFVAALLRAQQEALDLAPSIALPMLVLHGAEDAVCAVAGSEQLVAAAPHAQLQLVPGGKHEILNDDGFQTHLDEILSWFQTHANGGSHAAASD